MAGRNKLERFAFFIYSFAVWDLFYYVFLKILLDWPSSLFTWDILFLIPVPWVGPVLAPCIVSLSMILLAGLIIHFQKINVPVKIRTIDWLMLTAGSITVMISFMWDYIVYMSNSPASEAVWTLSGRTEMFREVKEYIPQQFNWPLFCCGQVMILLTIFLIYKQSEKQSRS